MMNFENSKFDYSNLSKLSDGGQVLLFKAKLAKLKIKTRKVLQTFIFNNILHYIFNKN